MDQEVSVSKDVKYRLYICFLCLLYCVIHVIKMWPLTTQWNLYGLKMVFMLLRHGHVYTGMKRKFCNESELVQITYVLCLNLRNSPKSETELSPVHLYAWQIIRNIHNLLWLKYCADNPIHLSNNFIPDMYNTHDGRQNYVHKTPVNMKQWTEGNHYYFLWFKP